MTKIEWTERTWNPIVGCSIVSPGCTNCYAMRMAARLERMSPGLTHYHGLTKPSKAGPVWTGKVALAPERTLTEPLRRKAPTAWFVNSMSDLFHEDVPDAWIDRVFAVMALCPQHTFQVLTKRSARMRKYITAWSPSDMYKRERAIIANKPALSFAAATDYGKPTGKVPWCWPLPNVWLGVSAERQQEADARIPDLLATPAAVRFVSAEPLLRGIDFTAIKLPRGMIYNSLKQGIVSIGRGVEEWGSLDWIIVGGESGPDARPMHPDWARAIRDQCDSAGTAFFFKQWGSHAWTPESVCYTAAPKWGRHQGFPIGTPFEHHSSGHTSFRVGKARAGRLLDGRTHDAMPAQRAESTPEAAA